MQALTRNLFALALACALPSLALAQSFPAKPIRLIVNLPPGTAADLVGRTLAPKLSESMNQPVLVENRPGATGYIGLDAVVKSAPDGYTIVHTSGSTIAINPHLYKSTFDTLRDLEPLAPTMRTTIILVVRADSAIRTVADLIAQARANPGKLNYGSSGAGSGMHIATEMMLRSTKTQATHIPYKGSSDTLASLLAGTLSFTFDPGVALPQIKAGKVRIIGVARGTRSPLYPDTPTMAEAGADANADVVFGIFGAAGTPKDIVARLNREIVRGMQTKEAATTLATLAAELVTGTAEEFAEQQRRDRERYGVFVREAGIKAD
ncbi:MAG: tripartite tricarboxylate transporter substrate binding protein [Betaproteobacteria bacterium]|nr:tripartite tricarboxylate transporter substrate binding protein [Betaproteobacteria bacterium]